MNAKEKRTREREREKEKEKRANARGREKSWGGWANALTTIVSHIGKIARYTSIYIVQ